MTAEREGQNCSASLIQAASQVTCPSIKKQMERIAGAGMLRWQNNDLRRASKSCSIDKNVCLKSDRTARPTFNSLTPNPPTIPNRLNISKIALVQHVCHKRKWSFSCIPQVIGEPGEIFLALFWKVESNGMKTKMPTWNYHLREKNKIKDVSKTMQIPGSYQLMHVVSLT